jgi:O-antigen ligase
MLLLKFLITFIFVIFPFGELLRFDLGNNIVIKPLDVLVFASIILFLYLKRKKLVIPYRSFFIFPLIGIVSLLFNFYWLEPQQIVAGFLYLVRWIAYFFIGIIVFQLDKQFKKRIIFLLLLDGFVLVLVGFLQYTFYNSLKNLFYLGWDEHKHRIFSTFFDPNFIGAFFVLYFLFLCGLLYYFIQKKKNRWIKILGTLLCITLIAIFLTYSRSALLMLMAGSVTFLTLIKKKKLVVYIFLAILAFGIIMSPKFYDENMNLFRMSSTEGRINNYAGALHIISYNPLIGVGFNTYRYAKQYYGFKENGSNIPSHADAGVDNSFLFVIATTGIVGLASYLWIWFTILKKALMFFKKKNHIGGVVVFSSGIAICIDALFINSLFFAPLMLWLWTLVGLMEDF